MSVYSTQVFLGYSVAAKGEDRHDGGGYQEEEGVASNGCSSTFNQVLVGVSCKFKRAIQIQNHHSVNVCLSWLHATLEIDHNVKCE